MVFDWKFIVLIVLKRDCVPISLAVINQPNGKLTFRFPIGFAVRSVCFNA